MQYIVIWSGNIPDEVTWYLKRDTNGWQFVVVILAFGQFVVPFLLLLLDRIRRNRKTLGAICLATLFMRLVEALVLAAPEMHGLNYGLLPAMLLAITILMATAWGWLFIRRLTPADEAARDRSVPSEA
jgi:hypothetical protein